MNGRIRNVLIMLFIALCLFVAASSASPLTDNNNVNKCLALCSYCNNPPFWGYCRCCLLRH